MCRNQVFSCENLSCTRRESSRGKAHSPRPELRRRHFPPLDLSPGSAAIPHPLDALRLWAEGGAAAVEAGVCTGSTQTPVAEQLQLRLGPPRPAPHPRARLCLPDPQRSNYRVRRDSGHDAQKQESLSLAGPQHSKPSMAAVLYVSGDLKKGVERQFYFSILLTIAYKI